MQPVRMLGGWGGKNTLDESDTIRTTLVVDSSGFPSGGTGLPKISEFHGIGVYMYFNDHLPPHVHVTYSGCRARVDLHSGTVLTGALPRPVRRLVKDWISLRRAELQENWELTRAKETPRWIDPL